MESILQARQANDKKKVAERWEPEALEKLFGFCFPAQSPWVSRLHLGRLAVFRVISTAEAGSAFRTLREMKEQDGVGELLRQGDVGLLVLAPTKEAKESLAVELKPFYKEFRIIVAESPNSSTVVQYIEAHHK